MLRIQERGTRRKIWIAISPPIENGLLPFVTAWKNEIRFSATKRIPLKWMLATSYHVGVMIRG